MRKSIYRLTLVLAILAQSFTADAAPYYRFWRGWKLPQLSTQAFQQGLNQSLLPQTVVVGGGRGLVGYLPFLYPAQSPAELPQEVALVVYESEQAYQAIRSTPEGQAYGDLHWKFFDKPRGSGSVVPEPYVGKIENGKAYDVLLSAADWRQGHGIFLTSRIHGDIRPYIDSLRRDFARKGLISALFLVQGDTLYEYQLWVAPEAFRAQWSRLRQSAAASVNFWPAGSAEMKRSDWLQPRLLQGAGLNMIF